MSIWYLGDSIYAIRLICLPFLGFFTSAVAVATRFFGSWRYIDVRPPKTIGIVFFLRRVYATIHSYLSIECVFFFGCLLFALCSHCSTRFNCDFCSCHRLPLVDIYWIAIVSIRKFPFHWDNPKFAVSFPIAIICEYLWDIYCWRAENEVLTSCELQIKIT